MTTRNRLAVLLLTTALVAAPGLAGSAYANAHGGKGGPAKMMACKGAPFTAEQKQLIHQTMHKLHEGNKQNHEEMHHLMKERHAAAKAQPYDKSAFLELTSQVEAKRGEISHSRAEALASISDKFSPEQRGCLMPMFEEHHGKHAKGMKGEHINWQHERRTMGEWHQGAAPAQSPTTIGQPRNDDGYPPYGH